MISPKNLLEKVRNTNKKQKEVLKLMNKELSNDSDIHSILRLKNLIYNYIDLEERRSLYIDLLAKND